jgi:hypothetical protein
MTQLSRRWFYIPLLILLLAVVMPQSLSVLATAGNVFTFDWQDHWKEYREHGYPYGSRLPCNGANLETCTWAWKPWYEHQTDLPFYGHEAFSGRTVSGYALMMYSRAAGNHNINAGVYRTENVQMCQTYRFTMNVRSGLEPAIPPSPNARMLLGISPTGFTPGEIVLSQTDLANITWSQTAYPYLRYENLSVEAEAKASTMALYTRAIAPADNSPYFFWDEGSFTAVARTDNLVDPNQPLPAPHGGLAPVVSSVTTTSAQIHWSTPGTMIGQVLYRPVFTASTPSPQQPHAIFLPLVMNGGDGDAWRTTPLQAWASSQSVQLSGLTPGTEYEYVVVSYGAYNGTCSTLISASNPPLVFKTVSTQ